MAEHVEFVATFYDGETSRPSPVVVKPEAERLTIRFSAEERRAPRHVARSEVRIDARLGNTPRAIHLDGDALLETENNAAVDALEKAWGTGGLQPYRFESNLRLALGAVVLIVALGAVLFRWGLPFVARQAAFAMSDDLAHQLGAGTLDSLDRIVFRPTRLPTERQNEIRKGFAEMAKSYPKLPLRLEFRQAGAPNAFALPNGIVIVTDELVERMPSNREIFAVLAHEIGHVEHRHTARMALESSIAALFMMAVIGDASQAAGLAGALPAIYANATFSQNHETEADEFALEFMTRARMDPEDFARALERLSEGESEHGIARYASSHPPTKERIARFRAAHH
ncbi:MAG TPA: M48 family metallopeptidase [Polyangiaceae bacterium]|nr:M48 family metallopeptidase [Polyangiaceae bacterium]